MKKTGFIALDLATSLYLECSELKLKNPVKDQLLRASLSIALKDNRREWETLSEREKKVLFHCDGITQGNLNFDDYYPKQRFGRKV